MAQYIDIDNVKFILNDVLNIKQLCDLERFQDYDVDAFELMLDSTKSFADKVLYPVLKEIDADPARYEDGKIIVHPIVKEVMKHAGENGSISATFDYEVGGMQLPNTIYVSMGHIAQSANNHLTGYAGLTSGCLLYTSPSPRDS